MEVIVIAAIVVAVLAFMAYPLFSQRIEEPGAAADALDSLVAQRDSAYDAIRDLDFDYQMGKLSQQDYELLRDKYKVRAAQLLQQIDELAGKGGAETRIEEEVARLRTRREKRPSPPPAVLADPIEQEVARLRARRRAGGADVIEQEVARLRATRSTSSRMCSQCGTLVHAGDQFCAECGNKL